MRSMSSATSPVSAIVGTTGLGPTIALTGDVVDDMDRIRAFYAGKRGIIPERTTEPRLADEAGLTQRLAEEHSAG